MYTIRTLNADEIEVRCQQVKEKGCVLLLYKDSRADMRLLDETFGVMGWQREHTVVNNNLFCTVSVWDEKKQTWIKKQDVGVESNTEKQKGEASDSFKRACVNIGIGRELYSSPFIWVNLSQTEVAKGKNDNWMLNYNVKFHVSEISYNDKREISRLVIVDHKGNKRFDMGKMAPAQPSEPAQVQHDNEELAGLMTHALQEADAAKTVDELKSVWDMYPQLQEYDTFKLKVTNRKGQLTMKK